MHAARLRRSSDIATVRSQSTQIQHRLFSVRARPNGLDQMRVSVSAPRSLGHAVRRNRIRRRVREAFRLAIGSLAATAGADLVIVARAPAAEVPYAELRSACCETLARIGGSRP